VCRPEIEKERECVCECMCMLERVVGRKGENLVPTERVSIYVYMACLYDVYMCV